jgi:signal transduction histidine kinase
MVDPGEAWSSQELAEFLVAMSSRESEVSAAQGAVERAAEALDAEVAAIVSDSRVIAQVGFAEGTAPVDELASVAAGRRHELAVPGAGACATAVVALGHPPGAVFILARSRGAGLSRGEMSILRAMARAASMTMRMLSLLSEERRLTAEQSALRRVATLVARGVDQRTLFTAVAEEVGRLASADLVQMYRYEAGGTATRIAVWGDVRNIVEIGERLSVGGHNLLTMLQETGKPARIDDASRATGGPAQLARTLGVRAAVGCPIVVEGRLWGALVATTTRPETMPAETERRVSGFTELVATAISNAHSRAELAASRARVVAASDETRRRIERDLHDGVQQRLVTLTLGLRSALDTAPTQPHELREQMTRTERGLQDLLEEVREISRGLHPAILTEAGLAPALKTLARRSAVPVELDIRQSGRLPDDVEVAAYFVVSEALTNVAKHASASVARVAVGTDNGLLRIQVSDDGAGGADPARGSGLVGLTDRVEALGGTFSVSSPAGAGTTMIAELPLTSNSSEPAE